MLARLLYASRATQSVTDRIAHAILETARKHNGEHGITGVLCIYDGGDSFLQVLEGGRAQVNELYGHIIRDERHRQVTLLDYSEVSERRFSGWRMGRVNLSKVNRSTILRFADGAVVDPFNLQAQAALRLLEELVDTAAISSQGDAA